jgi:hypothetical protein
LLFFPRNFQPPPAYNKTDDRRSAKKIKAVRAAYVNGNKTAQGDRHGANPEKKGEISQETHKKSLLH